mmetsp:Transcript_65602/g.137129  ORF Transcript_65602/g.137129 Transcript_65602/m.137129 type:complete len:307 (+) Transcript_65602:111-1031(+)
MASKRNDALNERTVEGSVNFYANQRCKGTAADRGLAERLSGCNYNIINNSDEHEIYLRHLRRSDHFVDSKGRHTEHFMGARRRKFAGDDRGIINACFTQPEPHLRQAAQDRHRRELQVAQISHSGSYRDFQKATSRGSFFGAANKPDNINNARYAYEAEAVRPKSTTKAEFLGRRGEVLTHAVSAPSLSLTAPEVSLARAMREDIRKDASHRQLDSVHVAPRISCHTYTHSMERFPAGREIEASRRLCSVNRLENYDFGITRKNNHFSSQDKLTRADPFYMRPKLGTTNPSVKYDIISNERRWFKY